MTSRARDKRRGFTVIELIIALALLIVLITKLTILLKNANEAHRRESAAMALEDQAAIVLDRISYAIIGSDPDTLAPDNSVPFFDDRIEYRLSLGIENDQVVWGDPEIIGLDPDNPSELFWNRQDQIVVWCRTVSDYYESEIENGSDDNSNGLADETGLAFTLDGDAVTIRLTLERETPDGRIPYSQETTVTCRN